MHAHTQTHAQIPLLPLHDKAAKLQADDLAARVALSPLQLPSCCFFTLLNTRHGGVTALTASPDTKHLAGVCLSP